MLKVYPELVKILIIDIADNYNADVTTEGGIGPILIVFFYVYKEY
jgi:hypothetical protein